MVVPLNQIEDTNYQFEYEPHEFTKTSIKMVKVAMQMDKEGAIYWLVEMAANRICILRQNPAAEMGDATFI